MLKKNAFHPGELLSALTVMLILRLLSPPRAAAENRADVKYENYEEENGRIAVKTASVLFDVGLSGTLSLRGQAVYDGISGATPSGAPPPVPGAPVPLIHLTETRYAGTIEVSQKIGRYTVTPQVAYSTESDYESIGLTLNQSLEFNQKNTTVTLGVSHNFDTLNRARSFLPRPEEKKDATAAMLGVTQLLGPKTVLNVNFTYGYDEGYLSDPYKLFYYLSYGDPTPALDKRPTKRDHQIVYVGLTQYVDPLNASFELGYRFYRDSFDVDAHTASLEWFQKLGRYVILSPSVRYYVQSAASFYMPVGPEIEPDLGGTGVLPSVRSSDYRLSELHTWTYGIKATVRLDDHVTLDVAFRRYEMYGDDGVTSRTAYPKANVVTVGGTVWF